MAENLPLGTLDDILAVSDSNEESVNIPEWGFSVKVRGITKGEQIRLRKQAAVKGRLDEAKLEGLILVTGLVSPKVTPDKVDILFEKSSGAVDKILMAIFRLSGMDGQLDEEAEADFRE